MEYLPQIFRLAQFKIDPRAHCYQSMIDLLPEIRHCGGFERLGDTIKRLALSLASYAPFLHCACCELSNETIVPGNFPHMLWGTKLMCKEHKGFIEEQLARRIGDKPAEDIDSCFPEGCVTMARDFGERNDITDLIGDFIYVNGTEQKCDGAIHIIRSSGGSISVTLQSSTADDHRFKPAFACMQHCLKTAKTELDSFIVAMSRALSTPKKRTYSTLLVPSGSDTDC